MRFLSLFSGIEAASVAWMPLGWQCVAVAEVDKFCNAVLANKYPTVLNIGDVNGITQEQIEALRPIELGIGGSPCQGFSVTGKRGGLDDSRSNLAIRFCELVAAMRPRWIVWENVPGVRSMWRSKTKPPRANQKGKVWQGTEKSDFGFFMDALAKCGYGLAYRSLDAQFSGLAQRRERVFLVGYLGDWRPAAAVLFERGGLSRHNPPSREAGQDSAPTLSSRTKGGGGLGTDTECDEGLVVGTIGSNHGNVKAESAWTGQLIQSVAYRTSGNRGVMEQGDRTAALNCATDPNQTIISIYGQNAASGGDLCGTLQGEAQKKATYGHSVAGRFGVRRPLPVECERLMGVPDGYTQVPYRGKPAADGPRYKALGNSIATPCLRWIAERIMAVEALLAARSPQ